jgi:hypothetical protein
MTARGLGWYGGRVPELHWTGDREFAEPIVAKQMIDQTPRVAIGALAENTFGRLIGKALPWREVGVLIAPLSGRSCFLYLVHVEAKYLGHSAHFGERRGITFQLEEDGHRALIDPRYARVRVRYEEIGARHGYGGCKPAEQELLARLQVPREPPGALVLPTYILQEARVEPGNRVTVVGSGIREADPQAGAGDMYRGAPRTRLHIVGSMRAPIALSTDPELVSQ